MSPSAKPFIWKLVLFTCKWTKLCVWIKLIFRWKALHWDSLWNRGNRQLRNELLRCYNLLAYFVLQQLLCEWPFVLWYRSPSPCGTSLGKYHGPPSEARLPPTTPKQGQAYHLPWFCQSLELCGCKTGNTWTFHFLFLGTTNWFNSLKGTILKLLTRRSHIPSPWGEGEL